ncbi:DNA repair protein RadA [Candidatus Shapirobacteria bacterium CG10_big_fil_rev_8_21_14_0_10_40_9]|uniref:DNA repair protein RadA n=1 Tax=Candidatus Shapirobacteria bacterium CG10_big_fil_rev_8_21_14_0_10_40_9 TaxID=1974888 RepID=A0A2M8L3F4_9BACT|nr:MAG: DNA repair protein RadA [Candidatus Shapirobacteria bacterium CG10_big_fil_rev_8_21_14_0_10_40_9]
MAKAITKFICQQCGYESAGFLGRCPSCGTWGSLVETLLPGEGERARGREGERETKPISLGEVKTAKFQRLSTKIGEFDRVLGGGPPRRDGRVEAGIVPGSVILLAGDPGIGKSTILLQVAANIPGTVLYISGEESPEQIKIRSERLGIKDKNILFLSETNVEAIVDQLEIGNLKLVIIDSIQTLYTSSLTGTPGSVGQVRECAARLLNLAKRKGIPMFFIGHVTKEGAIAGPMVLNHLVDTVLFFEGERFQSLRILRGFKNRFGPTDEVGVFEMGEKGLLEVSNPSKLFLEERREKVPGSVVTCLMEGSRPLLCEIQALVVPTQLAIPRRVSQGIDWGRLQLLTAVLSKRAGLPLSSFDVFVNVAGGIKVAEPGVDLAVSLAIASSFSDKPLDPKVCALGEVGLLGEIRQVGNLEKRVKEARRLGFTKIVSPREVRTISSAIKTFVKG